MKLQSMMKILLIFTLSLISGPVGCVDVIGYSGGSIIIISDLNWNLKYSKYICKVSKGECTEIKHLNNGTAGAQVESFMLYKNTGGYLKPQDAGRYNMGVGTGRSIDVNLKVVNDSCCVGPKITSAYPGQNSSIICNYPATYETNYKHIMKLDNDSVVKNILNTPTKPQNGRFSISDDRSAKVLSVNISDVREADGGVYLCGVFKGGWSVQYYSFFTEIQLHVTASMMISAAPTESPSDGGSTIIISVCVCVVLLLVGGFALMIYKWRHKRTQARGSTPSSKVSEQVPPAACVYEEINHTNRVSATDTELYMNASLSTNSPDREINSTVQPPQDHNITYTIVSFQKNPDDTSVTFSKEESATEYATVQHTSSLE